MPLVRVAGDGPAGDGGGSSTHLTLTHRIAAFVIELEARP